MDATTSTRLAGLAELAEMEVEVPRDTLDVRLPRSGVLAPLRSVWQRVWEWGCALPLGVQIAGWLALTLIFAGPRFFLLFVPVLAGVWLWDTAWPCLQRLQRRAPSGGLHGAATGFAWRSARRWTQHLFEMVIAMYVGMLVYSAVFWKAMATAGLTGWLEGDTGYAAMTLFMLLPMVALMRLQRHDWRMVGEMSFGMVAPVVLCFALVRSGLCPLVPFLQWLSSDASLYRAAHDGMVLGMIAAALYRRGMYAGASHSPTTSTTPTTPTVPACHLQAA